MPSAKVGPVLHDPSNTDNKTAVDGGQQRIKHLFAIELRNHPQAGTIVESDQTDAERAKN